MAHSLSPPRHCTPDTHYRDNWSAADKTFADWSSWEEGPVKDNCTAFLSASTQSKIAVNSHLTLNHQNHHPLWTQSSHPLVQHTPSPRFQLLHKIPKISHYMHICETTPITQVFWFAANLTSKQQTRRLQIIYTKPPNLTKQLETDYQNAEPS